MRTHIPNIQPHSRYRKPLYLDCRFALMPKKNPPYYCGRAYKRVAITAMLCCDLTTAPKKPISDLVSRLRHAPPCYLGRRTGFRHPKPSLWDTKE